MSRNYVINARFALNGMTGVPRSAFEITSRLPHINEGSFSFVAPNGSNDVVAPLAVERRGFIRQGHLWEQFELPGIARRTAGRNAILYGPATSGPISFRRQVTTIHDLFPIDHPEWFSRAFATWYAFLWPRLLPNVARIVVNSNYTRERVIDHFGVPEDKVVCCHFAQDERFREATSEEVVRFRGEQELPERYLLYIGSIEPRKNLATLVAAWKQSSARREGVKLVIAGSAGRADIFDSSTSGADALEDPTIHQTGFFPDEGLPLLYQGAEALALPSLAEGFGLPILEAMACGTPVICSDNTAMVEVSGGAARLVETTSTDAWSEAIDDVLSNEHSRATMREAGLLRASGFSWDQTARRVMSLLEEV